MNRMTMIEKGCSGGGNTNTSLQSKNIYTSGSDMPIDRPRLATTTTQRRPSLLNSVREFLHPRSGSLGERMFRNRESGGRKVQVPECNVEEVYDLRDKHTCFYDDDAAFRRPRSNSSDLLILRKTSRPLSVNVVGLIDQQADPYRQYMKVVDVYELCPTASKIYVVDQKITAHKAFSILKESKVGSLLVWDSEKEELCSIVTLTDLFNCLQCDQKNQLLVSDILSGNRLVSVDVSTKIWEACNELVSNKLHRVAVRDELGNVVHMITIRRVISAIHKQNRSLHFAQWLSRPIAMSSIGTWTDIKGVSKHSPVWRAVEEMIGCRFSTMPILDEKKNMVGVLTKRDICNVLPADHPSPKKWMKSTRIDMILDQCNSHIMISSKDTIGSVLDTLLIGTSHTAFVIHDNKPIGCVSLSDILNLLMRNPLDVNNVQSDPMTPNSSNSSSENIRGFSK